jgi:hypothetical protein
MILKSKNMIKVVVIGDDIQCHTDIERIMEKLTQLIKSKKVQSAPQLYQRFFFTPHSLNFISTNDEV